MPRQTAVRDRTPRTIRMTPELGATVEQLAIGEQSTFNDMVVQLIEEALQMRALKLDPAARETASIALSIVAPRLSALDRIEPDVGGNARLVLIECLLRAAISDATDRLLVPTENTEAAIALWSIAREISEELNLEGDAWDYLQSLGKKSPPPNRVQVEMLGEAIAELKKRHLDPHMAEKVEALDVYLGLARDEHEESWRELKREAKAARDAAFRAISRHGNDTTP